MIVSINQPAYLPWLGYFERIAASDLHVVLDHVQFEKNGFVNRNKVRTREGWTWLTVPVLTGGRFGDLPISGLRVDEAQPWRRKHWDTLRFAYARAAHFPEHAPFFEALYARDWPLLAPLLEHATDYLLAALGIATPRVRSSELQAEGAKDALVLDLCRRTAATTYLSGALGRDYLRAEAFAEAGIALAWQDYAHPTYAQAHPGFESHLSVVDLLFNHGPASLAILRGAAH